MTALESIALARAEEQARTWDLRDEEPELPLGPCACGAPAIARGMCRRCYGKAWRGTLDVAGAWWRRVLESVETLSDADLASLAAEVEQLHRTVKAAAARRLA